MAREDANQFGSFSLPMRDGNVLGLANTVRQYGFSLPMRDGNGSTNTPSFAQARF